LLEAEKYRRGKRVSLIFGILSSFLACYLPCEWAATTAGKSWCSTSCW